MTLKKIKNGDQFTVIGGMDKGKSGIVLDLKTSKTRNITITVLHSQFLD